MERLTAPNLAITKIYRKTNDENYLIQEGNYYVRSILYYVESYLMNYVNDVVEDYYVAFEDKELRKKLASIKCPEMQFNRPTIRELFQALFDVADLVFTLEIDTSSKNRYLITGLDGDPASK